MSTQYSCIMCGDDVPESAATIYDVDMDCEMPICDVCNGPTCLNCDAPITRARTTYCSTVCEDMDQWPAPRDDMERFTVTAEVDFDAVPSHSHGPDNSEWHT